MELVYKLLSVFGLAIIELWVAIPTGIALKLDPVLTGLTAAAGAMTGAVLTLLVGGRVRSWLARRHHKTGGSTKRGRLYRIWERYGVVGLGLLAPLLVGVPIGTAIGVALGAPARRLLLWIIAGVALWSAILALASALGLAGIESLMH